MNRHIQEVVRKVVQAEVKISPETKEMIEQIMALDFDVPETMNATNTPEAKREFLSDPFMRKPNFQFENITKKTLVLMTPIMDLVRYYREIWSQKCGSLPEAEKFLVQDMYYSVLDKFRFIQTANAYNAADEKTDDLARAFYNLQASVFSPPERKDFLRTLAKEIAKVREKMPNFSSDDFKKAGELKRMLGELWEPDKAADMEDWYRSTERILGEYRKIVEEYFKPFLATVPVGEPGEKVEFTPEEVCDWINATIQLNLLDEAGLPLTKFRAVVSDEVTNFSVNQQERLIKVPRERASGGYSRKDFLALIVGHEFGTHILRGIPFENCDLKMLSTGLPGYLEFEEGVACCTEMAIRGKARDVGFAHYTNIGLAFFKHKDFREVFEIRCRLNYLSGVKPGETPETKQQRWEKARNTAFAQTARCFRGTGELVNFKDLAYYNGTEKALCFISDHLDQPKELMKWLFLSGKIDATNETHRQLSEYVLAGSNKGFESQEATKALETSSTETLS